MPAAVILESAESVVHSDVYRYRCNGNAVMGNYDCCRKSDLAFGERRGVIYVYLYRKGIRIAYVDTRTSGLVKGESGGMGAGDRI